MTPPRDVEYGLRVPGQPDAWSWSTETGARLAAADRPGHPRVIRREWTCTVVDVDQPQPVGLITCTSPLREQDVDQLRALYADRGYRIESRAAVGGGTVFHIYDLIPEPRTTEEP